MAVAVVDRVRRWPAREVVAEGKRPSWEQKWSEERRRWKTGVEEVENNRHPRSAFRMGKHRMGAVQRRIRPYWEAPLSVETHQACCPEEAFDKAGVPCKLHLRPLAAFS